MKAALLLIISVIPFYAQIATPVSYDQTITLDARVGKRYATELDVQPDDKISMWVRTKPSSLDFGGIFRPARYSHTYTDLSGSQTLNVDGGLLGLCGSIRSDSNHSYCKGTAVVGVRYGDDEVSFWGKGGVGNFRFVNLGMSTGRFTISWVYGTYWENRYDWSTRFKYGFSTSFGHSSNLGWNVGLTKVFKP